MQTLKFTTDDGAGEAIKGGQDERWFVSMPIGDFTWYGSVPEVKREIARRNEPDTVKFEKVEVPSGSV